MTDLAWAAGFFEGEGNVRMAPSGKPRKDGTQYRTLRVTVSNTEPVHLERFVELFGGSVKERKTGELGKKRLYYWDLSGYNAAHVMEQLRPYMRGAKLKEYDTMLREESNDNQQPG